MENFDITEIDKRIMIYSTWLANTKYEVILLGNSSTFARMALYLGKQSLEGVYKGNAIEVDETLSDGQVILTAQKKGE